MLVRKKVNGLKKKKKNRHQCDNVGACDSVVASETTTKRDVMDDDVIRPERRLAATGRTRAGKHKSGASLNQRSER